MRSAYRAACPVGTGNIRPVVVYVPQATSVSAPMFTSLPQKFLFSVSTAVIAPHRARRAAQQFHLQQIAISAIAATSDHVLPGRCVDSRNCATKPAVVLGVLFLDA